MVRPKNLLHLARTARTGFFSRDPEEKNRSRYLLARIFVEQFLGGFRLYKHSHAWYRDEEYFRLWKAFPENNNRILDKQFTIHQLARSIAALPGDTMECGVYRGAGSYLVLTATEGQGRTHHLFDSFEGLSAPTREDTPADPSAHQYEAGELSIPLETVQRNLAPFADRTRYYKGWVPERFPEVADRVFAFCYIDVDLYEPTRDAFEFFYDRMVPGGLLVCDDYGFVDCPGAKQAVDDFVADKPEEVVHLTSGQGVIVKQGPRTVSASAAPPIPSS
ncbi:MAG: TylF/MycF/NovP-related O-methyltransferase [Bacteroidota bacterium]